MIKVENLTKRYGINRGVDNINFMVNKGECIGLLGPNGAGKSTIMKMITGYISPTEGNININGIDLIEDTETATSYIGFMSEIPPLYLDMTVNNFLKFVTEIKGILRSERKAEVDRVMKLSGIDHVSKRLIKNLSKGYKQRVGLAQALIGSPPILILDEPTAGLDPKQIVEVRNMILALREQHTIIISSHILSEISHMCEKVIIIKEGQLIAADRLENIAGDSINSPQFIIKVKGEKELIQSIMDNTTGIISYELIIQEGLVNDYESYILTTDGTANVRDQLLSDLINNNISVYELRSIGHSLEEMFLELVEDKEGVEESNV